VGSALITWAIWLAINWGELAQHPFPWPLIVNAFALMNLIRVSAGRSEIVNHEVQRLERKRAREIEAQNKKQLGQ
jgi:hypothetical protein